MRFLIDAQLPPALARLLIDNGQEAEHVADLQLAAAPDSVIWDYAKRHKAIIVTKDQDFAQRKTSQFDGPAIVWIKLPNTRRQVLLAWFESALPQIISSLERGEGLIEVT